MVVLGENQKFAAALIAPDFNYLKDFCKRHDIAFTENTSMIEHPEVINIYKKELKKYNSLFAHHEQIKNFALVADEWSIQNGMLTPTLKVKRSVIESMYKDKIEKLFL